LGGGAASLDARVGEKEGEIGEGPQCGALLTFTDGITNGNILLVKRSCHCTEILV
jgi:hypothetical protein